MAVNPNGASLLDPGQIVKRTFDPDNDAVRIIGDINITEEAIGTDGLPAPAEVKMAGGKDDSGNAQTLHVDTAGNLQIDVLTSALPTGAATEAKQDDGNASLVTIETNTTGLAQEVTLAAFADKTAGALVSVPYDAIVQTYITSGNGIGQVGTVEYKTGGKNGTVVATLTLEYDSNDRLISVE